MWRGSRWLRALPAGVAALWGTKALAPRLRSCPVALAADWRWLRALSQTAAPVLCGVSGAGGAGLLAEAGEDTAQQAEEERGLAADHGIPTFSIDLMVNLLRQENAKDICVIQLPPEMKYSDYFIIASGSSARHLHAMAQYVMKMYKSLKHKSEPSVRIEGKDTDDWLCIDFGNIVVHFMLPETRMLYELEKLWTLRSYDDQLAAMVPESLPDDFIVGFTPE
uniref:Mitochondrial assembly of ribosomal large subunit protein 1 n=1 Tax=Sphenodon punctatus TaxID=8508 RepID=A0A8D0GK55_SPHPU